MKSIRLGMTATGLVPRSVAVGTAATLMAGLAVAATATGASAGTMPQSHDVPQPNSVTAPHVPKLSWASCDSGFQCATARVPLDYQHPDGTTISIAVIRHLATDPARRIGSLFVSGGGPSPQVQPFAAGEYAAIPAELRERFDVITFDPRGFGLSSAVQCFPDAAAENNFLGALPGGFPVGAQQDAIWEKTWAKFDAQCGSTGGPLLQHDTSTDVARDMNLLREAVGAPKLNFIGLSYATGLGAVYANLFPATAGHIVLDGNLDPVAWTKGGSLPGHLRQGEDLAAAAVTQSFLGLCGKTTTAACAFSAGTPAATKAKYATLLSRLLKHPVSIGTPAQTFTYAEVIDEVPQGELDFVSDWQSAAVLLEQLWTASSAGHAATASNAATAGRAATASHAAAAADAAYAGPEQAIAEECADSADPRGTAAYEAAARLGNARSGGNGLELAWDEEPCGAWPASAGQDRYTGPWNHRTASPVLVIGNTGDPATPYSGSVAMSRDLVSARLLTVDGFGHTEFLNPDACATNYEISYVTTGALPPAGAVCKQDATPFPAS